MQALQNNERIELAIAHRAELTSKKAKIPKVIEMLKTLCDNDSERLIVLDSSD